MATIPVATTISFAPTQVLTTSGGPDIVLAAEPTLATFAISVPEPIIDVITTPTQVLTTSGGPNIVLAAEPTLVTFAISVPEPIIEIITTPTQVVSVATTYTVTDGVVITVEGSSNNGNTTSNVASTQVWFQS
jgi:hypothetical protein